MTRNELVDILHKKFKEMMTALINPVVTDLKEAAKGLTCDSGGRYSQKDKWNWSNESEDYYLHNMHVEILDTEYCLDNDDDVNYFNGNILIINDLNKSLSNNIINEQEYERIKSMILSADDEVVEVGVNLVLSMREKRFNNGTRTS